MAGPCAKRNPLSRSGLTQSARHRAELAPTHFVPDERDLADLVLFGQRFARYVNYYDAGNNLAGDWGDFFESGQTASLAALAKLPADSFLALQNDLARWLKADQDRDPAQLADHARLVFYLPFALLLIVGRLHARLEADQPIRQGMARMAAHRLAAPLGRLISYYRGALALPGPGNRLFKDEPLDLTRYNIDGDETDSRVRISASIAEALTELPALKELPFPAPLLALTDPPGWAALHDASKPDSSPYLDAIGSAHQVYEQVYDALDYSLLGSAVDQVYQTVELMRREAAGQLASSLESFGGHAPHHGLWLTFLQLFRHAQGELNRFTGRHLDYYFGEVLGLSRRGADPDKAHLVFELANGQTSHLLTAGTPFRAGKDATGAPVSYVLDNDIVINAGKVAQMRGIRVETSNRRGFATQTVRAALAVRSADGLGERELPPGETSWPAFGPATAPLARLGFAASDRKLFLREGTRKIILRAHLADHRLNLPVLPRWTVRLTGADGWFVVADPAKVTTELHDDGPRRLRGAAAKSVAKPVGRAVGKAVGKTEGATLEITVTLDAADPAIVPADPKLHGPEQAAGLPAIEVAFDFSAPETGIAFTQLRHARIEALHLRTEAAGVKNLSVVAGGANADPSKPFAPFGLQPRRGAHLILGSSEIFSKPIQSWRLVVDWQTPYSSRGFYWNRNASTYRCPLTLLSGGGWRVASTTSRNPSVDIRLGQENAVIQLGAIGAGDSRAFQTAENPQLGPKSVNGFARLTLPADFGHEDFQRESTRAHIALASDAHYLPPTGVNTEGDSGQTSLRLGKRKIVGAIGRDDSNVLRGLRELFGAGDPLRILPKPPYEPMITRLEAAYETTYDPVERLTHLHPFGACAADRSRLFPRIGFEGALLIGLEAFVAPARLTMLVQIADGSGNPLKRPPGLEISYLSGDDWHRFAPQDIDDKTANFAGSAVLGLNVPAEADTRHSVMPSGLHWIRVAVQSDSDALNRLVSVDAQAARVSFADAGNDPGFLATPLAAGSIAKLVAPAPAIKKITQPYSSFGGRQSETSREFATRVSERLRHKDRAVTMFDYEALVLQAFPRLYRAKCLGTTELVRDPSGIIAADNEVMPGAVTVVTVPWVHGQNSRDPLRPYADQATLKAVDSFLRRRISPFVRLEVQNPKFEEVRVEFKVRFGAEIGDTAFYIDELKKALNGFLTPWALEDGGEITFGGKLWKSAVIDFVEEQPHIDFITDFHLYHKVDADIPDGQWSPIDVEVIEATTARSILVSHRNHIIHEVARDA